MTKAFAAALAAFAWTIPAEGGDVSPGAVASGFYTVHASTTQDGIPDAKLRAKYAPFISPGLTKLLADGGDAETHYAKANPDTPPLVEGDLFSPNFEGVTSFQIGACKTDAKAARCEAHLVYDDRKDHPKDKPVVWTDTVYLVTTSQGWRVDDIAYGGTAQFGNHGRLSDTLKQAITDSTAAQAP